MFAISTASKVSDAKREMEERIERIEAKALEERSKITNSRATALMKRIFHSNLSERFHTWADKVKKSRKEKIATDQFMIRMSKQSLLGTFLAWKEWVSIVGALNNNSIIINKLYK